MNADVSEPIFVTEPGHVCVACNQPIPTGYYLVMRTFDASPADDPSVTAWHVFELHPSCALLWDPNL